MTYKLAAFPLVLGDPFALPTLINEREAPRTHEVNLCCQVVYQNQKCGNYVHQSDFRLPTSQEDKERAKAQPSVCKCSRDIGLSFANPGPRTLVVDYRGNLLEEASRTIHT